MHRNPTTQPIMHWGAFTSAWLIIEARIFIRLAALTSTVALGAIICRWQGQPFFPAVNEERTFPILLVTACLFFSALLPFMIMLEFI